jgi:hypothetical protein
VKGAAEAAVGAVEEVVEGAVGTVVVVVVRLPIARAEAGEAHRPRCVPSEIAATRQLKQFSIRSS